MSRRRTIMPLAALMLLAFVVSACGRSLDDRDASEKRTVTLIVQMKQGDYWNTVKMGAEVAAKEFGVHLAFDAPETEGDIAEQLLRLQQAIRTGSDAIVLAAGDYSALSDEVERANRLGIPVVAIDTEIDAPSVRSFIGTNNYEAGKLAGKQLIKLIGTEGQILMLSSMKGARNADDREKGIMDVLADFPGIQLAEKAYSYSDVQYAGELTRSAMQQIGRVDGIVALNGHASIGAAEQVVAMGLEGKVKVVAFDSTTEELELLQAGVIQATIAQNPYTMGYLGVKHAASAIRGDKVPERVETATKAIDLENMFWLDNQKLLFPFLK